MIRKGLKKVLAIFALLCLFGIAAGMSASAAGEEDYGDYTLTILSNRLVYNGELKSGYDPVKDLPEGMSIDFENRIITLDNANITGKTYDYGGGNTSNGEAIYYSVHDGKPLTVRLVGENRMSNVNCGILAMSVSSNVAEPDINLIIEGDGSLNINSSAGRVNPAETTLGISGSVRLVSGTLNLWTEESNNYTGIVGDNVEFLGGTVSIKIPNGKDSTQTSLYGISAGGTATFANTDVNIEVGKAGFAYGVLVTSTGGKTGTITINNASIDIHMAEAKLLNRGILQGQGPMRVFPLDSEVGVDQVLIDQSDSYFYMGNEGPDIYFARADAFAAMQGWTDVNYPYLSISPTPFEDVEIPDPDEPATEPEQPFNFTDVKGNDWFYDSVDYVNASGIMTGLDATTFGPNEKLARAQLAVILHRLNEEPEMTYSALFPDVPDGQWFTDAILWAADAGVVTGYSNTGFFGTGDNINREQIATMMYRYARYKGYSLEDAADFSSYPDAAYVNEFAEEAMAWAVGNGIITGKENPVRLDPQGLATRAECATIIMRFMETFEK